VIPVETLFRFSCFIRSFVGDAFQLRFFLRGPGGLGIGWDRCHGFLVLIGHGQSLLNYEWREPSWRLLPGWSPDFKLALDPIIANPVKKD
jgi:hypothetical protein